MAYSNSDQGIMMSMNTAIFRVMMVRPCNLASLIIIIIIIIIIIYVLLEFVRNLVWFV
jgi:t-SNARE complex subunit (syntaxin)